jgi:hypothetical protein
MMIFNSTDANYLAVSGSEFAVPCRSAPVD